MKDFYYFWLGVLLISLTIGAWTCDQTPMPHANCCLCMCHAKDETLCSRMCLRLQHGKKVVEEPEMIVCTHECERVSVNQIIY